MKTLKLTSIFALAVSALLSAPGFAKDKPISIEECPAPVQAVIRQYAAQGTLEEIGLDEKKKSGGPAVYEAKFSMKTGKRIEVHIAADGKVLQTEEKKPKGS